VSETAGGAPTRGGRRETLLHLFERRARELLDHSEAALAERVADESGAEFGDLGADVVGLGGRSFAAGQDGEREQE
jgi:hypothetical protein